MIYLLWAVVIFWQAYLTFLIVKIRKHKEIERNNNDIGFRVGLVKFNPFEGVGSNQSFCMALLGDNDSGIILTSLHGRNGTRVYAREINASKLSAEKLSDEEKEAIRKALAVSSKNK